MPDFIENNYEHINHSLGIEIDNNLINLYRKWDILSNNFNSLMFLYTNLTDENFNDNKEFIIGYIDIINSNREDINICWENINFYWDSNDDEFKMINRNLFNLIKIEFEIINNTWFINHFIICNILYIIENGINYNIPNNNSYSDDYTEDNDDTDDDIDFNIRMDL